MILEDTISLLRTKYSDYIETLYISEVRMGVFMTAVRLSDNSYGISSTIPNIQMNCYKKNRDFGDFTPNKITGFRVIDLLESTKKNGITETLKVAALNAISSKYLENPAYKILRNTDPIDLIDLNSNKSITIVGAFQSYIQKISKTNTRLFVLELNEDAFNEEDKKYYVPAIDYPEILPVSDIVIITGLTLVNGTLDGLLKTIKPETQIIVTGPSSSFIPEVLFANNVKILGAVKITDPELMFKVVSEAGAGYHMFEYCAEKICIVN